MAMVSLADALAGGIGGVTSTILLYPLEFIKTQMQSGNSAGFMGIITETLKSERGFGGFFDGVKEKSLFGFVEKFCYFYFYKYYKSLTVLRGVPDLAKGYAAEWSHMPLSYPLDILATRVIVGASVSQVIGDFQAGGIASMYKGINANLFLSFKPAIIYSLFDFIKKRVLAAKSKKSGKEEDVMTPGENFLYGAVARGFADAVVFPSRRAKIVMQSMAGNPDVPSSTIAVWAWIVKTEGFGSLYQGLATELGRGVISSALLLMVKEYITGFIRTALGVKTVKKVEDKQGAPGAGKKP